MGRQKDSRIDEQGKKQPMEINVNESIFDTDRQYKKAKRKVHEIRSFYINLSLFSIFIPIIIAINLYFVPEYHWFWFSMIGWGTSVIFHGLAVFDCNPFMQNNWEERKIKQFIDEELEREKLKTQFKKQ